MGSASEHQAVVAFNDLVALGVVVAAASAGVDVPGDVSIVGSDDIQPASMSWPPLTSVASPIDTIGRWGCAVAASLSAWTTAAQHRPVTDDQCPLVDRDPTEGFDR